MDEHNDILKDILDNPHDSYIPADKLMAYLEGRLGESERRAIEEILSGDGMESDALDGLQKVATTETRQIEDRLNRHLHKTLKTRNSRSKPVNMNIVTLVAIAILLGLILVTYFIICKAIR